MFEIVWLFQFHGCVIRTELLHHVRISTHSPEDAMRFSVSRPGGPVRRLVEIAGNEHLFAGAPLSAYR